MIHIDTPMTNDRVVVIDGNRWVNAPFARSLERELNAANERIRLLIAERDTAQMYADQKWKLRREFHDLFGTDDVEQAVAVVRDMKNRIKRLEEAGDAMRIWITVIRGYLPECTNNWTKAKNGNQ